MSNPTEQLSASARHQMQAQLGLATSLAGTMIDSVEKIIGLNLNAAKASLETSLASTQQLLAARDPQEFFSLTTHQAQPHAEIALTYGHHLASIASGTHVELTRVAEDQLAKSSRQMVSMLGQLEQMAPTGSEGALSLMKSALDNVSAGYGQFARNSKLAVETMESSFRAASAAGTTSTGKTSRARR